jgi:hypothetical protein
MWIVIELHDSILTMGLLLDLSFSCILLTKKSISYYRIFGGIPQKYFCGTCTYTYKYLTTFI